MTDKLSPTREAAHLLRCAIALLERDELRIVAGESRVQIAGRLQTWLASETFDEPASATEALSEPAPDQDAIEAAALRSFDKNGHPEHTVESYVAGWVDCAADFLAAPSTPTCDPERPGCGVTTHCNGACHGVMPDGSPIQPAYNVPVKFLDAMPIVATLRHVADILAAGDCVHQSGGMFVNVEGDDLQIASDLVLRHIIQPRKTS